METSLVERQLAAAKEQIRFAQGQLDAAIQAGRAAGSNVDTLDCASGSLREAHRRIDAISRQIDAEIEAAPAMRDCSACGKSIRAQATRCGYCWEQQ